MSVTGKTSGLVSIAAAGAAPLIQDTISSETPVITQQIQGTKIQAASTGPTALSLGGVANAVLVHLRFFDNSTGAAKKAVVRLNGTITTPASIEFLYVSNDTAGGITSIDTTTEAGNDTKIEYTIGGN